jgi:hypothetical protein
MIPKIFLVVISFIHFFLINAVLVRIRIRIASVLRNRLDPDPENYMDPDPDSVNTDPKHNSREKTRVSDLDPDWIRIQSGQWIRIRIWNQDPDPEGQK